MAISERRIICALNNLAQERTNLQLKMLQIRNTLHAIEIQISQLPDPLPERFEKKDNHQNLTIEHCALKKQDLCLMNLAIYICENLRSHGIISRSN